MWLCLCIYSEGKAWFPTKHIKMRSDQWKPLISWDRNVFTKKIAQVIQRLSQFLISPKPAPKLSSNRLALMIKHRESRKTQRLDNLYKGQAMLTLDKHRDWAINATASFLQSNYFCLGDQNGNSLPYYSRKQVCIGRPCCQTLKLGWVILIA